MQALGNLHHRKTNKNNPAYLKSQMNRSSTELFALVDYQTAIITWGKRSNRCTKGFRGMCPHVHQFFASSNSQYQVLRHLRCRKCQNNWVAIASWPAYFSPFLESGHCFTVSSVQSVPPTIWSCCTTNPPA